MAIQKYILLLFQCVKFDYLLFYSNHCLIFENVLEYIRYLWLLQYPIIKDRTNCSVVVSDITYVKTFDPI